MEAYLKDVGQHVAPLQHIATFKISKVIMLPVFPIMALSGPLFTEMNDGEAQRHGAAGVVVAKSPTPLAFTFQDRWFKYV